MSCDDENFIHHSNQSEDVRNPSMMTSASTSASTNNADSQVENEHHTILEGTLFTFNEFVVCIHK